MTHRLTITLHVDPFDMVQGGGITWYDTEGRRLASVAWPALPGGERTVESAATLLAELSLIEKRRQLTLF